MHGNEKSKQQNLIEEFAPDYSEDEIGRLTEIEYETANLLHEIAQEREHAEQAELVRSFEEELERLFATIKPGEPDADGESVPVNPPGWPAL